MKKLFIAAAVIVMAGSMASVPRQFTITLRLGL